MKTNLLPVPAYVVIHLGDFYRWDSRSPWVPVDRIMAGLPGETLRVRHGQPPQK
jgi:hypothetical protein